MGQKKKVGKQRKDKYYHLAKETGYRSRAAFKLIQLNRKFEFLQKSRVLVDLCAAPGGWMQVAVEHMPVSAVIVGVDLFPIKPVAGCISIQEDITNSRCLQLLKKELKTWKADVVLHDGAPNVGQNWLHDAYSQACLTLSAFKLATQLLRQGGYFVTKVFRSKDYNALLWVFQQFFKNVFSTKPAASRTESAEIFVVCKGYLAPTVIDPKFLDAKHVFEDIDVTGGKKQLQQLLQEIGKKKKAEGYPTDEALLYRPITAADFISSPDYIDLLANTSQIIIGQDWIDKSEKTTSDIREYCKDVKVLSKKEIKTLISWRKVLRDKLAQYTAIKSKDSNEVSEVSEVALVKEESENEEDDDKKLDQVIAEMKNTEMKEAKRKRKKLMKERHKIHEKTNLKMIIPGDIGPTDTSGDSLFSLNTLQTQNDVEALTDGSTLPMVPEDEPELTFEEELKLHIAKDKTKRVSFNKDKEMLDSSGRYYIKISEAKETAGSEEDEEDDNDPDLSSGLGINDDNEEEDEQEDDLEEEEFDIEEVAPIPNHPLITDLDHSDKNQKRLRKAQMWFDKPIFEGLDDESDEDTELNRMADSFVLKGAQVLGYTGGQENSKHSKKSEKNGIVSEDKATTSKKRKNDNVEKDKHELGVVSSKSSKKKLKLDVQGMALGSLLVQSQKTKRDLMDDGWNKYAFNDPGLPDWFVQDEKKHMKKAIPVPNELIEEYKSNLMEINARPIKKVVEAKYRKKKRAIRKLEKAKKKAEAILDKSDMTENEKANQIKQLYKKATMTKKKEVKYIVAKKFNAGKKTHRPAGVKGPYKVVDPRMKKDLRKMKLASKDKKGKGKGKGKIGKGKPSRGNGKRGGGKARR